MNFTSRKRHLTRTIFMNFTNLKSLMFFTLCMLAIAQLCCSCRTSKATAEAGAIASDSTAVTRCMSVLSTAAVSSENIELHLDTLTISTVIPVGDTVENVRIKAIGCRITSHKEAAAETVVTDVHTDSVHDSQNVSYERRTAKQSESPSSSMLPLIALALIATILIAARRK